MMFGYFVLKMVHFIFESVHFVDFILKHTYAYLHIVIKSSNIQLFQVKKKAIRV